MSPAAGGPGPRDSVLIGDRRGRAGAEQSARGHRAERTRAQAGAGPAASPKGSVALQSLQLPAAAYLYLTLARKVLCAPAARPGTTYAFLSSPLWKTFKSEEGAVRPAADALPGSREGGRRASHLGPEQRHPCARGGAGAGHVLVPVRMPSHDGCWRPRPAPALTAPRPAPTSAVELGWR